MEDRRYAKAVENHKSGFNCAASVLMAFCIEAGLSPDEAKEIAKPYAGGGQKICGAVAAAKIVLENKYGAAGKEMGEELEKQFLEKNGSVLCKEIRFKRLRTCRGCVEDAAMLLTKMA